MFSPAASLSQELMAKHMMASLKADGKMAVVMPHGVLFLNADREFKEGKNEIEQLGDIFTNYEACRMRFS